MEATLLSQVRRLVDNLVSHDFAAIVADGRAGRLTQDEIRLAVEGYPAKLITPPETAWSEIEEYELEDELGDQLLLVPLWTDVEGRSDLVLSVAVKSTPEGYRLGITSLHVM
jgi:hypothetical protein